MGELNSHYLIFEREQQRSLCSCCERFFFIVFAKGIVENVVKLSSGRGCRSGFLAAEFPGRDASFVALMLRPRGNLALSGIFNLWNLVRGIVGFYVFFVPLQGAPESFEMYFEVNKS